MTQTLLDGFFGMFYHLLSYFSWRHSRRVKSWLRSEDIHLLDSSYQLIDNRFRTANVTTAANRSFQFLFRFLSRKAELSAKLEDRASVKIHVMTFRGIRHFGDIPNATEQASSYAFVLLLTDRIASPVERNSPMVIVHLGLGHQFLESLATASFPALRYLLM
ncbi:hypothetical protein PT974_09537 [Cladobotryum mycophilum]|uniref:Uncharacterized protein n=1 Tax=Cladobotryum mycophilum TaxID=491253 RepID=A0ABR0SGF5_9HYPO